MQMHPHNTFAWFWFRTTGQSLMQTVKSVCRSPIKTIPQGRNKLAQPILSQPQNLRVIPTLNCYVGDMRDLGIFRRHGVPYYFLSCGTREHYHMPTDTPDRLNYANMAAITHYVVALLSGQDAAPFASRTGVAQIRDTLALKCRFLRDALGSFHQPTLHLTKLNSLTTRKDMDRFTRMLLSMGLG